MLALTNTGKTINLYMDEEDHKKIARDDRVSVSYNPDNRVVVLRPDPKGRKISKAPQPGKYRMTIPSNIIPELPLFSREAFENISNENGIVPLRLSENLKQPTLRKTPKNYKKGTPKKEASEKVETIVKTIESTLPNLVIKTSKGKSLSFKIPDDKLLDLCLELAHNGYAI